VLFEKFKMLVISLKYVVQITKLARFYKRVFRRSQLKRFDAFPICLPFQTVSFNGEMSFGSHVHLWSEICHDPPTDY
jgi:hypothetical protein